MISSDFRTSHLSSGVNNAKVVFEAYQPSSKEFGICELACSGALVMCIDNLFSELVTRPSWGEKVFKNFIYLVLAIHTGVVLKMRGGSVDPESHEGIEKRVVQVWKYTARMLSVTHVALMLINIRQNRTRTIAYVTTLVVCALEAADKLPKVVKQTWSYQSWVTSALALYDGSPLERNIACIGLTMMLFQRVASLSK